MASAICLTCGCWFCYVDSNMIWNTKNKGDHIIVIIAKGNIIEGIEAQE